MVFVCGDFVAGFKFAVSQQTSTKRIRKDICAIIESNIFTKLQHLIKLLSPFTKAIAILERDEANMSEVMISLFKITQFLCSIDVENMPPIFIDLHNFLLNRLFDRQMELNKPEYLVALYLHPRYRLI